MRMTVPRWPALGFLAIVTSCYTQAPLSRDVPVAEMRLVAQVTDTGVLAMSNAIGPGATQVEGIVAGADATSWDLRLLRVTHRGGQTVTWKQELVRFPRSALSQATERRFSNRRSWIMAALVTSSALLAARFLGVIGGDDNSPAPPPPPN